MKHTAIKKIADILRAKNSQLSLYRSLTTDTKRMDAKTWKAVALEITGQKAKNGKDARVMILQKLSDDLLVKERAEQVKQSFRKESK